MKHLFKLAIITITFASCSNPLDKSILTPLAVDELTKAIENDSTFESFYTEIQQFRTTVKNNELKQAKWAEVTYQSLLDYHEFNNDTSFWNPEYERLSLLWQQEYDTTGLSKKVDSVSNHWKNYLNKMDLNNYVTIDLVELDKVYYSSGGFRHANLGFKLTPLQGKLEQVIFSYELKPKITEDKKSLDLSSIFNRNRCLHSKPLYKTKVSYWKCNYSDEDLLKNNSYSTLKRDYNLNIVIEEIRKGGVNYDKDDIDIPFTIELLWENKNSSMYDYYRMEVYQKYINQGFVQFWEYANKENGKILKEKYPLEFEFNKLINSKKFE